MSHSGLKKKDTSGKGILISHVVYFGPMWVQKDLMLHVSCTPLRKNKIFFPTLGNFFNFYSRKIKLLMITESVQKKKNKKYLFQEEMVISIYFLNILADTRRTVKL